MRFKMMIVPLAIVFLAACTAPSAHKINKVSIGMTKAEVISVMGRPDSVAAHEGIEYLNYRLATSKLDFDGSDTSDYFVRLVNGRVDAYGRKGDFETTVQPRERIEVDVKHH